MRGELPSPLIDARRRTLGRESLDEAVEESDGDRRELVDLGGTRFEAADE